MNPTGPGTTSTKLSRLAIVCITCACLASGGCLPTQIDSRQEVIFWHFWGGADRAVVDNVVERFNATQQEYVVRAIAMPGNNLDLKLFLAVTGGDPPDLVNQDDPILADWAERGALLPLDQVATPQEIDELKTWLFPAAYQLGTYQNRAYGLCNGLDVRALYFNQTMLDEYGLQPPKKLAELDHIAETITPSTSEQDQIECFGFLPNPKLLWSWGIVFGGSFYNVADDQITLDTPPIAAALEWMAGYGRRYGTAAVSFRTRDQSLPGKSFPLLAGRYATIVDGQWRVRDIQAAAAAQRNANQPVTEYGVCPLPAPPGGNADAGWVNGNFFLIPRGSKHAEGAWRFMKFWTGLGGNAAAAAETCVAGGWIPVSQQVVDAPAFQEYLQSQPLFATFVELAASPHQIPRPNVIGARLLDREIRNAAAQAIYRPAGRSARELLQAAEQRVQAAR